jgi:acetyltransferase-like isoleucine patch superfamily enzyme
MIGKLYRFTARTGAAFRSDGFRGAVRGIRDDLTAPAQALTHPWARLWMLLAGPSSGGRLATRIALLGAPRYKARKYMARLNRRGYIAPSAIVQHPQFLRGSYTFLGDRVVISGDEAAGPVVLGDRVHLHNDTIVETGSGGGLRIGRDTHIQARCQFSAHLGSIHIGENVQIAPNCAFYPYDHGTTAGIPMSRQPLTTKGDIVVGNDAWLGFGVVVLSGVRIGEGAVIGAGSLVTRDIPAGAIAVGNPARVVRMRAQELAKQ